MFKHINIFRNIKTDIHIAQRRCDGLHFLAVSLNNVPATAFPF